MAKQPKGNNVARRVVVTSESHKSPPQVSGCSRGPIANAGAVMCCAHSARDNFSQT
ncbi:hypothetical protein M404DRAFT_1002212 [Pisolithus tinctorius Marx 270]|uniref:Uncharacterized protein n=1 Tax=Pisolithus tinctorius Marx 270 TaxID=870435 RepID=A0A0C3P526_PISTI|nr:hypothetical protein M404DRAFT_1002212 [Pisolithus tinctorius Marx 270]